MYKSLLIDSSLLCLQYKKNNVNLFRPKTTAFLKPEAKIGQ